MGSKYTSNAATTEAAAPVITDPAQLAKGRRLPIVKTDLKLPDDQTKLAFTLDNVFTPEECADLVRHSETHADGYSPALINTGGKQVLMTDVRNNDRIMLDDPVRTAFIYDRIKEYLPQVWGNFTRRPLRGLNERLRFLRYDPGQKFEAHYDGTYVRLRHHCPSTPERVGERSYVTVQVYINEGCRGGETTFLSQRCPRRAEGVINPEFDVSVEPKIGRVLVFQHDILHQGSEVMGGRKYVIRTDAMYAPSPDD